MSVSEHESHAGEETSLPEGVENKDITDPGEARLRIIQALATLEGNPTSLEISARVNKLVGSLLDGDIGIEWLMVPTDSAMRYERTHRANPLLSPPTKDEIEAMSFVRNTGIVGDYNAGIATLVYNVRHTTPADQVIHTVGDLRATLPNQLINNYYNTQEARSKFLKGLVERRSAA